MNFYLETISSEALMNLGQYVPLCGVIASPALLSEKETDVEQTLKSLAEAMPLNSVMYVFEMPVLFRKMLAEARDLIKVIPSAIPALPAEPQGYMTMKSCRTLELETAAWGIMSLEQAVFSGMNGAGMLLVSWKSLASAGEDPVVLLESLLDDEQNVLVCDFESLYQVRQVMEMGFENIGLSETLLTGLLNVPAAAGYMESVKDRWFMTYTRDTILK